MTNAPFSAIVVRPAANPTGEIKVCENYLGFVADAFTRMLAELPGAETAPTIALVVHRGTESGATRIDGDVAVTRIGARLIGLDEPDETRILSYLGVITMAAVPNATHQMDRPIGPLLRIDKAIREHLGGVIVRVGNLPAAQDSTDPLLTTFYGADGSGTLRLTLRLTDHRWNLLDQKDFSVTAPDYPPSAFDDDVSAAILTSSPDDPTAVGQRFAERVRRRDGFARASTPLEWPPRLPATRRRPDSGKPMTEQRFWAVIDRARRSTRELTSVRSTRTPSRPARSSRTIRSGSSAASRACPPGSDSRRPTGSAAAGALGSPPVTAAPRG